MGSTFQERALRKTVNDLLIDPVGSAMNDLRSMFAARRAQRNQATDSMSARVMQGSKSIPARSGFDNRGTDRWLNKKPRT